MAKFKDLLKALLKNGLKILSKKCQLIRKALQYSRNPQLQSKAVEHLQAWLIS